MVTEITDNAFTAPSGDIYTEAEARLRDDYAAAMAEYNRLMERLAPKEGNKSPFEHFEMYDAPGVGNYVIPKKPGWRELIDLIGYDYQKHGDHTSIKARSTIFANVDFSANVYPAFDGKLGEHFESPYLLDPLDDHYESFKSLRDNIAAVRNFLLQAYFANPPEGLTAEKARANLAEIAAFVGDGLNNNYLFAHLIPNHDPRKPFIDLERAREGGGKGAQYIYEKILEHQRHSSWLKPFDKLTEFFGGKVHEDWHLPGAEATGFRDVVFKSVGTISGGDAALQAVRDRIAAIEAQLGNVGDARALSTVSTDLDAVGNHLLYTAAHMDNGDVAHLDAPVRMNAVEIAREILRKLKFTIGDQATLDGLNMQPSDDMAVLGAVKGVSTVFERLLAWARSNNDAAIFAHPAVRAATRAIGELGLLAKLEGLRMADLAGNHVLVERIREQISRIPDSYRPVRGVKVGELLNAIESGMNTIINRTQEVSVAGAKVGFSRENTLGQSMSAAPVAGQGAQMPRDDASRRNAAAAQADQQVAQAQAQQIHAQLAATARTQAATQPQASTTPATQAPARSGATVGRAALRAAQTQRASLVSANTTSSATPQVNLTPAQQMQARLNANQAAGAQAAREREEQLKAELQRQQQQQLLAKQQAQKAAAAAAMAKAKATVQNLPPGVMANLRGALSMQGVTDKPVLTGQAALSQKLQEIQAKAATQVAMPPSAPVTPEDKLRPSYVPPPPSGPQRPGGGRGY